MGVGGGIRKGLAGCALAVVGLGGFRAIAKPADPPCTRESSRLPPAPGPSVTSPIPLIPDPESDVVNFGGPDISNMWTSS